jgi:hypothetical protein
MERGQFNVRRGSLAIRFIGLRERCNAINAKPAKAPGLCGTTVEPDFPQPPVKRDQLTRWRIDTKLGSYDWVLASEHDKAIAALEARLAALQQELKIERRLDDYAERMVQLTSQHLEAMPRPQLESLLLKNNHELSLLRTERDALQAKLAEMEVASGTSIIGLTNIDRNVGNPDHRKEEAR